MDDLMGEFLESVHELIAREEFNFQEYRGAYTAKPLSGDGFPPALQQVLDAEEARAQAQWAKTKAAKEEVRDQLRRFLRKGIRRKDAQTIMELRYVAERRRTWNEVTKALAAMGIRFSQRHVDRLAREARASLQELWNTDPSWRAWYERFKERGVQDGIL